MTKRTVLGMLMLALGMATATSVEGLMIALPLLALGLYTFVPVLAGEHAFAPPRFSVR